MLKPATPSRRGAKLVALPTILAAVAGLVVVTSTSAATSAEVDAPSSPASPLTAQRGSCPGVVNARAFTSKAQLRKMTAKFNSFGPRILGSAAHNKAIAWLEKKARASGAQHPLAIRSSPTAGSRALVSSADPVSTSAPRAGSASPDPVGRG